MHQEQFPLIFPIASQWVPVFSRGRSGRRQNRSFI
jgi:hypothetical protein